MALDVGAILAGLTLEEKAALCTGASAWTTTPVERLGLPALTVSDGPHGVRRVPEDDSMALGARPATCFPTASNTASSWNPELLREMGAAIADEAAALGVDVVLGPGVNIKRSPLCGRNFEYFSEDPHLAGELATAYVEGMQARGVGASVKHFAVNNQETRRMSVSAELDERTLREIYLPAFEAVVTRAQPWTVMCSYNRINGAYGSEHHRLLTEILRDEWGFKGFVVSDWGAVHDRVRALAAGMDLEMPGPRARRAAQVADAVRSGRLDEAVLNTAVTRILRVVERAQARPRGGSFDAAAHHALARRIAAAGMVLLRNDGILPLAPGGRLAVIGRAARTAYVQGGGSSEMTPTQVDVPLDELARLAGDAVIRHAQGDTAEGEDRPDLVAEAVEVARASDTAILVIALPEAKESEGYDRTDLDLTAHQVRLIQAVCAVQPRTVVVLGNGAPVAMGAWLNGTAAVVEAWMAGQAAGGAIADVLFGVVNPSGRLAETIPLRLEDTPAFLSFPGDRDTVRYGEGIFVGYRWYERRAMPVQFPFGFGLSYTTFTFGPARVSTDRLRAGENLVVEVDVTNTGAHTGAEVVQVYVADDEASVVRPVKELKGFARLELAPGETGTARITLPPRAFSFFDPDRRRWVAEPGRFTIHVGASSADIRSTATVTLGGGALPGLPLTTLSPVADWLEDAVGGPAATTALDAAAPALGVAAGGSDARTFEALPPPFREYLRSMPLHDVLEFAAAHGGPDPDTADAALQQAVAG